MEFHYKDSLPVIIRAIKSKRMRGVEQASLVGQKRHVYKPSVEIYEGKRPLGKPRRRWEDNIKWISKK
jgi:hypothetical protein